MRTTAVNFCTFNQWDEDNISWIGSSELAQEICFDQNNRTEKKLKTTKMTIVNIRTRFQIGKLNLAKAYWCRRVCIWIRFTVYKTIGSSFSPLYSSRLIVRYSITLKPNVLQWIYSLAMDGNQLCLYLVKQNPFVLNPFEECLKKPFNIDSLHWSS